MALNYGIKLWHEFTLNYGIKLWHEFTLNYGTGFVIFTDTGKVLDYEIESTAKFNKRK